MRCSASDTHIKLLDRAVSGAGFLTGGVFVCNVAHRQSLAVLCVLYEIRCNPMKPPLLATYAACASASNSRRYGRSVVHLCDSSQHHKTFIRLSVSLWNDLADPVFDGMQLVGFESMVNFILLAQMLAPLLSPTISLFISFHGLLLWGWGLRTDGV